MSQQPPPPPIQIPRGKKFPCLNCGAALDIHSQYPPNYNAVMTLELWCGRCKIISVHQFKGGVELVTTN